MRQEASQTIDRIVKFFYQIQMNKKTFCIPGCFERAVTYSYLDGDARVPIPMSQIESLIQLSEFCDQDFQYDCTLAPLRNQDVDFAFWEDRTGGKNNYFTGKNQLLHCILNF